MKKTIFLSMLSLLLLVGCNSEESSETPNAGAGTQPSDVPVGFEVGNRAPEITGEDIDGAAFKLSDYRGKVVMLDFWGDW